MQSVPITTKVVNSNPVHGEVYLIQHYVVKFVSNFQQVSVDNMKQLATILVHNTGNTSILPVSAILVQILVNTSIPVSSRIFQYLQY